MRTKKRLLIVLLIALSFLVGLTQLALAYQDEDYTLATVPALRNAGGNGNIYMILIESNNPPYTEVLIEQSDDNKVFTKYLSWRPLSSYDSNRFSISLEDGQSVYLRIKARNQNGIETEFSEGLRVDGRPVKPVPQRQEQTTDSITIHLPPLEKGMNYWVMREDVGIPQKVVALPFVDNSVMPAREYTYVFWSENDGVESEKNTITLWTKPALPGLSVKDTFYDEIVFTVDLKDNPKDIEIHVDAGGEKYELYGNEIRLINLSPTTRYTVKVRLKSKNNEYTDWVAASQITTELPQSKRPPVTSYREFLEEAKASIDSVQYRADGEYNSGTGYIEVRANYDEFIIEATINNKTRRLTRNFTRFDGLSDNTTYDVEITVSNEDFTYSETITVTTPNRTPPKVEKLYYDKETGEIIMEVKSVKGIKK